jgi:DNA-binding transcriptional regulator YiaG
MRFATRQENSCLKRIKCYYATMRPEQLRAIREGRGWTREKMASFLGDCTASTVNKWERGMHSIPGWVEDKLLRTVEINLPIQDLSQLLSAAKDQNKPFEAVLTDAIRAWIQRNTPAPPTTYQAAAADTPQPMVAEEPPPPAQ